MNIIVNDRFEIPYGKFSVDYVKPFYIENKYYYSVLDFVITPLTNNVIISKPFEKSVEILWQNLERQKMLEAINKALEIKSRLDPEFEGLVLSAENKTIQYLSENDYLGVDFVTKTGYNLYGKILTSYKDRIINKESEVFYNSFLLDRLAKKAINYEDMDKYLQLARKGYGILNIIDILYSKYGTMIDIPSKDMVNSIRQMMKIDHSYKPEEIILSVIKSKIRTVRAQNIKSLQYKVFSKFLNNVMQKYSIDYDILKFVKKINKSELDDMIDKLYTAYYTNRLSNVYIDENIYIPTEDSIEKYESMNAIGYENKLELEGSYAIVDSRNSRLSLKDDRVVLPIDGKNFLSIGHYIIYNLGTLVKDFDPYTLIVNPEDKLYLRYDHSRINLMNILSEYKKKFIEERLFIGLKTQFSDKSMFDFLKLTTGDILNVKGFENKVVSNVLQNIRDNSEWKYRNGIDLEDAFFVQLQKDMYESFISIVNIITPGDYSYENIETVYNQFFGNINGVIHDKYNVKPKNKLIIDKLPSNSEKFLYVKFLNRIYCAEELAKKEFNTDIDIGIKFLILNSQYRIATGGFLDASRIYRKMSLERLAMAKTLKYVSVILESARLRLNANNDGHDPVFITKSDIDKSFVILNNTNTNLLIVEDLTAPFENSLSTDGDSDSEKEIEGYDTDEEDEYDDLMFGTPDDADEMANSILKNMSITTNLRGYFENKTLELYKSENKNLYRIYLLQ